MTRPIPTRGICDLCAWTASCLYHADKIDSGHCTSYEPKEIKEKQKRLSEEIYELVADWLEDEDDYSDRMYNKLRALKFRRQVILDEAKKEKEDVTVCDWCKEKYEGEDQDALIRTNLGMLCDHCIAAIRSRGEEVLEGYTE